MQSVIRTLIKYFSKKGICPGRVTYDKKETILIKNGATLAPNCIYVLSSTNQEVEIKNNMFRLKLHSKKALRPLHPISRFFSSLAHAYKNHAIGVVLSGTGSDGTEGLKVIRSLGGITFAQSLSPSI